MCQGPKNKRKQLNAEELLLDQYSLLAQGHVAWREPSPHQARALRRFRRARPLAHQERLASHRVVPHGLQDGHQG